MPWGKMDDKFHRNRKVRRLRRMPRGYEALGMWSFWWSWCLDDPELNGVVPAEELSDVEIELAELLCSDLHQGRGLWVRVDGGYLMHDFHDYNPTAQQVDHKRKSDRERIAAKRAGCRADVASDSPATRVDVASESLPARVSHSHPIPIPTQREEGDAPAAPPVDSRPAYDLASWENDRGAVCFERKVPTPRGTRDQERQAAEHVRDIARVHGVPCSDAARALAAACLDACQGAKGGLKEFPFIALTLDPFAAPAGAQGPSRPPRVVVEPGAFSDAPSVEEQIARMKTVGGRHAAR